MALRAWHVGWPIAVFQFVKSPKWRVGEETALRVLGESGQGGSVTWHKMGEGWSWLTQRRSPDPQAERDHAAEAAEGWAQIKRDLAAQRYRFYVLDEFTYPMGWGWVDPGEVVDTLLSRPGNQHVVVTGRNAPAALVQAADLVTEMSKVKHPMDSGRKGQQGIEW
jgi:cob(I)alamin adenosyltransferase